MKRLRKGTTRDIDVLTARRDAVIVRLQDATTRLRRAQTFEDRYLRELFRVQSAIDALTRDVNHVTARLTGKGKRHEA